MVSFQDVTETINEPKTARMEQRTKPHVKAEIQAAAALLGVDETAFVIDAAYARARDVIEDHERTRLTTEDRDAFLAALIADAPLTDAMREAAGLHEKSVVDGE